MKKLLLNFARSLLMLSWVILIGLFPAWAESVFDKGVAEYSAGHFPEAISAFEQSITQHGDSVGSRYNLGNALYRNGEVGRAIAEWRLAERGAPWQFDIRSNLEFARTQLGVSPVSFWDKSLARMRPEFWGPWALGIAWTWFVFFLLSQRHLEFGVRYGAITRALKGVAVIFLIGYCISFSVRYSRLNAVVVKPNVGARFGPVEEAAIAFPLADGTEVRVYEERGGWSRVVDSVGHSGWVQKDDVFRIP
ncbi:MAG: tetratricopeptide repeat protein [Pedosphaera sp.]|nr:tetratricopeptide repeat protein [Pedosphaera sp.]